MAFSMSSCGEDNECPVCQPTTAPAGWAPQTTPTSVRLTEIEAVDGNTLFVAADSGVVLKTTDGGVVWRLLTTGTNIGLGGMSFVDSQTGWVCGDEGTILKTTDGGNTWTPQSSGTVQELRSIYFVDADTGWASGGPRPAQPQEGIWRRHVGPPA
jgi:photosystem II stability/assembly factor-like uncharacterized protein